MDFKIRPWLVVVLIIVAVGVIGYLVWFLMGNKTPTPTSNITLTPAATNKISPSPSTTPSSTPNNLIYSNPQYKFSLTFPSTWSEYRIKEANFPDSKATYYVNMPTKDPTLEDITQFKGYFSPFAISVYTLDQWSEIEKSEGPTGELITKNSTYAFGWSQANGIPPTDWDKGSDIEKIIESLVMTD